MIWSWALFWYFSVWSRLEFPVLDDSIIDSAYIITRIVNSNTLGDGCRVIRIRKVPCLAALYRAHVVRGVVITALVVIPKRIRFDAPLSPKVALTNIMVVRNRNGGTILDNCGKLCPKQNPSRSVLRVVICLVTRKKQQVRI